MKLLPLLCLFVIVIQCVRSYQKSVADADMSRMPNIYYDPKSQIPFRLSSIENMLINKKTDEGENDSPSNLKSSGLKFGVLNVKVPILRRFGFRSNGCTCQQLTCGCCLGINLNQFQFNREVLGDFPNTNFQHYLLIYYFQPYYTRCHLQVGRQNLRPSYRIAEGCMNFTYDPQEFSVNMNMIIDGNSVFCNTFSAKNPPALCIPVPIPYIPIQVETCAKLFDIYTPGQNLHMCFDFETRIEKATVLVLHFDCMRMGNDGVAFVKPGDTGALPPSLTSTTPSQTDFDVYDQVTEIKKN